MVTGFEEVERTASEENRVKEREREREEEEYTRACRWNAQTIF